MRMDKDFAEEIAQCLIRFGNRDWGDSEEHDKKANDEAMKTKERVVAVYKTTKGKVQMIYENNHTTITIMFTNEY